MSDFLLVSGASLLALAALQGLTFWWSRREGRVAVVDVVWGAGFVLVALVGALLGSGDLERRLLLLAIAGGWGLRLTWHLAVRIRGKDGEDPRYAKMLDGASTGEVVRRVFVTQGLAQWFISLPIQVAVVTGPPTGAAWALVAIGALVSVGGVLTEAIADRQLAAFKADASNRGKIMDRGLWGWSRHPNYFGDACVWSGIYLIAAAVWPGPLTILSPAAMVFFLVVATGARLLERQMADRPGYREYQARTSFFVPLPPKRA